MFIVTEKIIHNFMTSREKILKINNEGKFICVGLDTDLKKIPIFLLKEKNPVLAFNKAIIESTKDYAAAYKINFAFYEQNGAEGFEELEKTLQLIPTNVLSIADAKRGDIGNTSKMYAKSVYDHFGFDSVTLNPYMGKDSLEPFLEYEDKINFILILTSNPGANDFEKLKLFDGNYLYQNILDRTNQWNTKKNCGIVFGATKITELKDSINSFGDLTVLLPGVGAQGGSIEEVSNLFKSKNRKNYIVNVSRGIIYKSSTEQFAIDAQNEIINLNKIVSEIIN
jgi:orotidine-5'-phosphate decarboxylase